MGGGRGRGKEKWEGVSKGEGEERESHGDQESRNFSLVVKSKILYFIFTYEAYYQNLKPLTKT